MRVVASITTLLAQPGFESGASAIEDAGFDRAAEPRIGVRLATSGSLDDLTFCR